MNTGVEIQDFPEADTHHVLTGSSSLGHPGAKSAIVQVFITHEPPALHNFIEVVTDDLKRHVIHHRRLKSPLPNTNQLIGMTVPAAKKYLQQDKERAEHE